MRFRHLLAVLALVAPGTLQAQDWSFGWFPNLLPTANEFPLITLGINYNKLADYYDPYTQSGHFQATAAASFKGSWRGQARFRAPGLWPGWRLDAWALADRAKRFGYYGLGNDSQFDQAVFDQASDFYRVQRTIFAGQVEIARTITGPLRAAVAGRIQRNEFSPLDGPSIYGNQVGAELAETDGSGRVSLVLDTRDTEYRTQTGVYLETGAKAGTGGDGYGWFYGIGKVFVSPREGTVIGLRIAGGGATGTPPLSQSFEFNTAETMNRWSYGGQFTNRGMADARYAGSGLAFGNLEARHDLLSLGDLGAITLLAYADAGRVYGPGESFTLDDLRISGGGGAALRFLRSNVWTFNFSGGPDGFQFHLTWGWVF